MMKIPVFIKLDSKLEIYLGLLCARQNGECGHPGSDYLWFQKKIIILHTCTRGKPLSGWLT